MSTRPSNTKIVATVGPACDSQVKLAELIVAGVDVFRLNMAHGSTTDQGKRLLAIRAASQQVGQPVAVLADLAGPKIRLGELPGGELTCHAGAAIRFVRGDGPAVCSAGDENHPPELTATYAPLIDELAPGDRVLLADGTVSLSVESVSKDFAQCRVIQPGTIRSRQGINLPGVNLSVAAMSDVDRANAVWAVQNGIDFLGLSFVRKAQDIVELKDLIRAHGGKAQVIAKIEKPEALDCLEAIVAATDGVMVARGDLGVETDIAQVAVAQKMVIETCNKARKPVIVATQMLDSMHHSRLPTRAEVADVSNAILDGADACMLSGETAIGEYPREAVEMMHRIALSAESLFARRPALPGPDLHGAGVNPITEASVNSAVELALSLDAKLIVVATSSGQTALTLAKHRCFVPVVGLSDDPAVLRRMALYWGVTPLVGNPAANPAVLLETAMAWGKEHSTLAKGDRVVLIAGSGLAVTRHNVLVVHELG